MHDPQPTDRPIRVDVILGTRPEAIKLAPVIQALQRSTFARPRVISTGQHRDLVNEILHGFGVRPDHDLGILTKGQSLTDILSRSVRELGELVRSERPELVLVQGDTTSALAGALAAFYERVHVGHVEAGLRSGSFEHPFPEEANRALIGRVTRLHFAPTPLAARNLLAEGTNPEHIHICGNTVIDALRALRTNTAETTAGAGAFGLALDELSSHGGRGDGSHAAQRRLVLVTAHRRENWGDGFAAICRAVRCLADEHGDIEVLFCLHPNPELQATAARILGGHERVTLSPPRPYVEFIGLLARAYLVLSDSGGVQEEATALGKPVLLLRETTERPEGVTAGTVRLVGTAEQTIVSVADELLRDGSVYRGMARPSECFGDGFASERIVQEIGRFFGQAGRLSPWVPTGVDVPSLFGTDSPKPVWCS